MTVIPFATLFVATSGVPALFAHHGGFGLNLNPLDTNLINLVIVIGVLVWFLKGFLGGMLERRREAILADLSDAEQRLQAATAAVAKAQQDLAAAQQKAEQIRADGKARAEAIRLESEKRTVEEMARVKQGAAADLDAEAARVTDLLRREAARQAIEKALATLPGKLDGDAQARLIDQSINTLGNA
jgi:F-type H+-transporting ATPase subunit b